MLRDFSETAKQKLLKYVDEVTATGTWDQIKDFFGDIGLTVQSWFGKLDIQKYVDDVDTYHKKVLDKNNTTARQIEEIFSNVQAVDTRYLSIVIHQRPGQYHRSKWRKHGYGKDERCFRRRYRKPQRCRGDCGKDHRGKDAWNRGRRLYEQ